MTIFQKRLNTIKNSIDAEVYESLLHSTKEERFDLIQWHLDNDYSIKLDWLFSTLPENTVTESYGIFS